MPPQYLCSLLARWSREARRRRGSGCCELWPYHLGSFLGVWIGPGSLWYCRLVGVRREPWLLILWGLLRTAHRSATTQHRLRALECGPHVVGLDAHQLCFVEFR